MKHSEYPVVGGVAVLIDASLDYFMFEVESISEDQIYPVVGSIVRYLFSVSTTPSRSFTYDDEINFPRSFDVNYCREASESETEEFNNLITV